MGHGIITRRGIDTSSATATSNKIIAPYTAFVNGVKLTGDVVDYSGSAVAGTPYNVDGSGNFGVRIPNSGVYSQNEIIYASASSIGIDAGKIIDGHSILGVTGTQSLYEEDDLEVVDLSGYSFIGKINDSSGVINTTGYSNVIIIGYPSSASQNAAFTITNSVNAPDSSSTLFDYRGDVGKSFVVKFTPFAGYPYIHTDTYSVLSVFIK